MKIRYDSQEWTIRLMGIFLDQISTDQTAQMGHPAWMYQSDISKLLPLTEQVEWFPIAK